MKLPRPLAIGTGILNVLCMYEPRIEYTFRLSRLRTRNTCFFFLEELMTSADAYTASRRPFDAKSLLSDGHAGTSI
jgi:hypothetical protein